MNYENAIEALENIIRSCAAEMEYHDSQRKNLHDRLDACAKSRLKLACRIDRAQAELRALRELNAP